MLKFIRKLKNLWKMEEEEVDENYFELLPVELIVQILQNLPPLELVRAKSAFHILSDVADRREVWKRHWWKLNDYNSKDNIYEKELKIMPKIQIVKIPPWAIEYPNCSIEAVIKSVSSYVEDLQSLHVETGLSRSVIIEVIQKYPNLQDVTLKVEFDDALAVLQNLASTCIRLQHLAFTFPDDTSEWNALKASAALTETECKEVRHLLEHSFAHLTSINLIYFQPFLKNADISAILEEKKSKLKCFNMCLFDLIDYDLIKIISRCSRLTLSLYINPQQMKPLNLKHLCNVKYLFIYFCQFHAPVFELRDLFEFDLSFSLPNVKILSFDPNIRLSSSDYVKSIVNLSPNLKHLELCRIDNENFNDQLSHLKFLPDLVTLCVTFSHRFPLSHLGVSHISQCSALRNLTIYFYGTGNDIRTNDDILLAVSNLQNLNYLKLINCVCSEEILRLCLWSLDNLKVFRWFDEDVPKSMVIPHKLIARECRKKNISVFFQQVFRS